MAKAVTTRSIPSRAHHGMTAAKASQQRRVLSSLQQLHAIAAGRGAEESRAGVRGGSIPGGPKDARCFPQLLPRALAPRPSKQRPLLTTPAPLSLITFSSSRCRRSSSRPDVLREACAPAPPGFRELSDYAPSTRIGRLLLLLARSNRAGSSCYESVCVVFDVWLAPPVNFQMVELGMLVAPRNCRGP